MVPRLPTEPDDLARIIATPSRFAMHVSPDFMGRQWEPHPWLLYLERQILTILNRPGRAIIIVSVPPQEGKTTYCGMFLPGWYLGMFPDNQVLFIAYNEQYAGTWGSKTQSLIERYGHFFGVKLSKKHSSTTNWKTSNGFGGMLSAGILGGITGNPGHLILIDDLIKTMEEANSITQLNKIEEEYDGAISTRFQEDTKVLITNTRFAEGDLSGRLIERAKQPGYTGPPVYVLNFKAIAEPDFDEEVPDLAAWRDILGRKVGEPLRGQHSAGFFAEKKGSLRDMYVWNALYQGSPAAREGGMFPPDNWRYYQPGELPQIVAKVRVWDPAATEGGGDPTTGALWGRGIDDAFYLLDLQEFQKNSAGVQAEMKRFARADGFGTPILIEQEKQGSGKAIVEVYSRMLLGHNVQPARVDGSKEERATPYSAEQNKMNCFLPADAPWLEKFKEQHRRMMGDGRRPRHDDMIDVSAYAVRHLILGGAVEIADPTDAHVYTEDDIDDVMARLGMAFNG